MQHILAKICLHITPPHPRNSNSPTHSFRNPTKCSETNRHSKLVYILVGKLKIQYTVYTIKTVQRYEKAEDNNDNRNDSATP